MNGKLKGNGSADLKTMMPIKTWSMMMAEFLTMDTNKESLTSNIAGLLENTYFDGIKHGKMAAEITKEMNKRSKTRKAYVLQSVEGEKLWSFLNFPSEVRGKFYRVEIEEIKK